MNAVMGLQFFTKGKEFLDQMRKMSFSQDFNVVSQLTLGSNGIRWNCLSYLERIPRPSVQMEGHEINRMAIWPTMEG